MHDREGLVRYNSIHIKHDFWFSEWANFRGIVPSGWSGRGGQTTCPYYPNVGPSGSSSGSAVAVAVGLAAAAIGSETDGSIVMPGSGNNVVGIKPTVGVTSRAGGEC